MIKYTIIQRGAFKKKLMRLTYAFEYISIRNNSTEDIILYSESDKMQIDDTAVMIAEFGEKKTVVIKNQITCLYKRCIIPRGKKCYFIQKHFPIYWVNPVTKKIVRMSKFNPFTKVNFYEDDEEVVLYTQQKEKKDIVVNQELKSTSVMIPIELTTCV